LSSSAAFHRTMWSSADVIAISTSLYHHIAIA